MARLDLNIFSFDSRIDFQNGYVRESLHYRHSWRLKDLLNNINPRNFGYQELGLELAIKDVGRDSTNVVQDTINIRINNYAVFENLEVSKVVQKFGNYLTLEPLSTRYVKKDLLVDYDLAMARFRDFFQQFSFISPDEVQVLKGYLPINFIPMREDEEYLGDGFILYVRWLMKRYPAYKLEFLRYISMEQSGIFNRISVANLIFEPNNEIDLILESLQKEILSTLKEYEKFSKYLESQYDFEIKTGMLG